MKSDPNIRNLIVITDKTDKTEKYILNRLSDIELAAMFSKNKNNYKIFKKLLLKMDNISKTDVIFYELIKITTRREDIADIKNIKLLIKYGVDINNLRCSDLSFLFYCCANPINSFELIKLLIENTRNINIIDNSGQTPLMYILEASEKISDLEIIKLFIRKGSKINFRDKYGYTPLMFCFKMNYNTFIRYDIIKILLDNKADIYIKNKKGKHVLDITEKEIGRNNDIYSLIFNYKNIKNDHFCECDINFIY